MAKNINIKIINKGTYKGSLVVVEKDEEQQGDK